jgi:hypothetical protein
MNTIHTASFKVCFNFCLSMCSQHSNSTISTSMPLPISGSQKYGYFSAISYKIKLVTALDFEKLHFPLHKSALSIKGHTRYTLCHTVTSAHFAEVT